MSVPRVSVVIPTFNRARLLFEAIDSVRAQTLAGFDVPLMELAAFRFGLSVPAWFDVHGKSYSQPRYRYNPESHLDLYELLTNFGASRLNGGLNLAATMLGKPGKMAVQGHMVQDLFDEGKRNTFADAR